MSTIQCYARARTLIRASTSCCRIVSGTTAGTEADSTGALGVNIVGNTSNYWSVSATASDEAKAAATNYLDTVVFDEEYTQMLLEGGGVPPVEGMEDAIAEIEDSEFVGMAYDMVKEAPHFQLSWDQALPPDQAQELLTNLEKVFLLQSTPEQFVDAMNKTIG